MKTLTLERAKTLQIGDVLHSKISKGTDGQPHRWKVNGKVKTWKRDTSRVKIPVKHGLYCYDYLTENNLHLIMIDE